MNDDGSFKWHHWWGLQCKDVGVKAVACDCMAHTTRLSESSTDRTTTRHQCHQTHNKDYTIRHCWCCQLSNSRGAWLYEPRSRMPPPPPTLLHIFSENRANDKTCDVIILRNVLDTLLRSTIAVISVKSPRLSVQISVSSFWKHSQIGLVQFTVHWRYPQCSAAIHVQR